MPRLSERHSSVEASDVLSSPRAFASSDGGVDNNGIGAASATAHDDGDATLEDATLEDARLEDAMLEEAMLEEAHGGARRWW